MGLGPALREAVRFANGKIRNARFAAYRVPRFEDLPRIDVHLVRNDEIPSAGAGETPMIAVAPAVGNAVFAATGLRFARCQCDCLQFDPDLSRVMESGSQDNLYRLVAELAQQGESFALGGALDHWFHSL